MRAWIVLLTAFGCGGDESVDSDGPSPTTSGTTPATGATPSDTGTDTPSGTQTSTGTTTTGTPTGGPQVGSSHVRVVNLSPALPELDMFVNDVQPPILYALPYEDGTPWTDRPVNTFNFKFAPSGGTPADAVVEFDLPLLLDTFHTLAVYGDPPGALQMVDDNTYIGFGDIRLRWTNVARGIGQIDLTQTNGVVHADDLDYADTVVIDVVGGWMTVGLDTDDDGVNEYLFEPFNLAIGTMNDVYVVNDCDGCTPFLIAHQPDGTTPRKDVQLVP